MAVWQLSSRVCAGGPPGIRRSVQRSEGSEGREASGRVVHGAHAARQRLHRDALHEGGDVRPAAARHQVRTLCSLHVFHFDSVGCLTGPTGGSEWHQSKSRGSSCELAVFRCCRCSSTNQKFCFWLAGSTRRRRRWRLRTPLMSGWQVSSPQCDNNCVITQVWGF